MIVGEPEGSPFLTEVVCIGKRILFLMLGLFALAAALILYFILSHRTAREEADTYIDIQQAYSAVVEEPKPATLPKETQQPEETAPALPRVQADFDGLRELNPDTVGWVHIPDTPISYPVMQAADNSRYLKRDSKGNKSSAGAVFMDAGNCADPLDTNTVLYGHNMGSGREDEMFAPLLQYKDQAFYEAHSLVQFDTHLKAHGWWEIFAVLHIDLRDKEFNYLTQSFADEESFSAWLGKAKARSLYDTGVPVATSDRILILSTCDRTQYRGNGRFVVMAVWRGTDPLSE